MKHTQERKQLSSEDKAREIIFLFGIKHIVLAKRMVDEILYELPNHPDIMVRTIRANYWHEVKHYLNEKHKEFYKD